MSILCLLICPLAPGQDQPTVTRDRNAGAPACLLAGAITDPETSLSLAAVTLSELDPALDSQGLWRRLGALLGQPPLDAVDTSEPVRIFCLDPRTSKHPEVIEFAASDLAAVRRSVSAKAAEPDPWCFAENDGRVILSRDPRAVSMAETICPLSPDVRPDSLPGQFRLWVNLPLLINAFESDLSEQIVAMKARMRESMSRLGAGEAESRQVEDELDLAVGLLRQVKSLDIAAEVARDAAIIRLRTTAAPGSILASLAGQPACPGALMRDCPDDAYIVAWSNISFGAALQRHIGLLLQMAFGARAATPGNAEAYHGGEILFGLFPASSGSGVEMLEIRSGPSARDLVDRWSRWSAPEGPASSPVHLTEVPAPPGPFPARRLAHLAFDPGALEKPGGDILRAAFGPRPMAALAEGSSSTVMVISADPPARLSCLDAVSTGAKPALDAQHEFRRTFEGLCPMPNALIYISPECIRRWLEIARIDLPASPSERIGIGVAVTLRAGGEFLIEVALPSATLRDALHTSRGRSEGEVTDKGRPAQRPSLPSEMRNLAPVGSQQ